MVYEHSNPVEVGARSAVSNAISDCQRFGISIFQRHALSELSAPEMCTNSVERSSITTFAGPTDSVQAVLNNPELRTALDGATSITITADTSKADIILKPDGSVEQFLKMNRGDCRKLVVALEEGEYEPDLGDDKQFQMFKSIMEYAKNSGKSIAMDFSHERQSGSKSVGSSRDYVSSNIQSDLTSQTMNPHNGQEFARTTSDTRYSPPVQIDWSRVDLFDLLLDWFGSDEETFKKLMPGLYKKIAGADGNIDRRKLRSLVDSRDPDLNSLRAELPRLATAFPNADRPHGSGNSRNGADSGASDSGATGGKVSTSCDAVNPTGAKLADKAAQVSNELGTYGYCAKGVSYAIERATGKIIYGNANDMRKTLPDEGFTVSNSKNLKVGQVVHVYWTPEVYAQEQARRGPCPNYGDIAVIGKGRDGQLYAYNDAATPLNDYLQKSRYDWNTLKVFNPPNS